MQDLQRRQALGLLALGGLASTTVLSADKAYSQAKPLDLSDTAGQFDAYIRMRGALDDQLVIGYISGSYFGIVGSEVTPLWDVVGATFTKWKKRPDGGYDAITGEIAHFLDPQTGQSPGEFHIPYTGQTVKDPRHNLPPNKLTLQPNLQLAVPKMMPGAKMDHQIRPPQVRGDDIWFTDVTRVDMPVPGKEPFRYSEMVTMNAKVSDLANRKLPRVPTYVSFSNVVAWRPWMQMGDHPGHLMAIGSGRYGVTLADLPDTWTAATKAHFPHVLANPASVLEPLLQNF